MSTNHPYVEGLSWHIDEDIDTPLEDSPVDRRISSLPEMDMAAPVPVVRVNAAAIGTLAAHKAQAAEMARACLTLDDLKAAIAAFEVLDIKRTATQIVFASGQVGARVMVIGEAPDADDDRQGVPFAGAIGQFLDKMFDSIGLNRATPDVNHALYISNILNWRPPGGRPPTDVELALSLPFIERHIALARPDCVVLMGTVAGKLMLNTNASLSRMRGKLTDYVAQTPDIQAGLEPCTPKVMATYHPSYLIQTPAQKRATWQDLLMLQKHLTENQ